MPSLARSGLLLTAFGDLLFFAFSLWLALYLRTLELPTAELLFTHLVPFSFLFGVWMLVFLIAGLYERQLIERERDTASALINVQVINIIIAALFFFLVPVFGLAPKTILFIYLLVSLVLIFLWRVSILPKIAGTRREVALVLGEGKEIERLATTLSSHPHALVCVTRVVPPGGLSPEAYSKVVLDEVREHTPTVLIVDFEHPTVMSAMAALHKLIFKGIRFMDAVEAYGEVYGRVPLSLIGERWVARNVTLQTHRLYDTLKRLLDLFGGFIAVLLSLPFYPFIALAIKLEDGGRVFIVQERIGKGGTRVRLLKFRSMQRNETVLTAQKTENKVTRVGSFIRATRLDELPQLIGVLRGDLSLIGPRPELPSGVALYEQEIPYYGLRHLIKPGLSGWAQVYHHGDPHHAADIEATRDKLSYDLYYLKNRSFTLDLAIGLKTIRKLLTQRGS